MALSSVFELQCSVKVYNWGKIGKDSKVAQLAETGPHQFVAHDETPYAELWMGTHVNGPSLVISDANERVPLSDWLIKNQDLLGQKVVEHYGPNLPFLFKVLSVRTALSIQAHPNKTHAELLHKERPDLYKDDNHKPEMAIALTEFHCFCGFRPISEIAKFMQDIKELRTVVGIDAADCLIKTSSSTDLDAHRNAIKACISGLMECDERLMKEQLDKLVNRVQTLDDKGPLVGEVLLKLHVEFPGDIGGFLTYFCNYIVLQPGDAIFLAANVIHAYLYGDCIECMACSDNVVRAGLTAKYADKATLVEMIDCTPRPPSSLALHPSSSTEQNGVSLQCFTTAVKDFGVTKIKVSKESHTFVLPAISSASIMIVIEGSGRAVVAERGIILAKGSVIFISANTNTTIEHTTELLAFRAFCNV